MKRSISITLILFLIVSAIILLAGCDSEEEKEFIYEIKNVSKEPWALNGDFETDFVYTGDNYTLGTSLTIEPGESEIEYFTAERLINSGRLKELSEKTYEIELKFIAGQKPEGSTKEHSIDRGLIMQNLTIKGTYGKTAVIEWDGKNFKQTK